MKLNFSIQMGEHLYFIKEGINASAPGKPKQNHQRQLTPIGILKMSKGPGASGSLEIETEDTESLDVKSFRYFKSFC